MTLLQEIQEFESRHNIKLDKKVVQSIFRNRYENQQKKNFKRVLWVTIGIPIGYVTKRS